MRGSPTRTFLVTAILALVAFGAAGCVWVDSEEPPEWLTGQVEEETAESGEESGPAMPGGGHGHGGEVLMMGRSVMEGWMEHWGWNWEDPVQRDGYTIYFHALEGPPQIGADAAEQITAQPDGTVVFFKLCFDDFWAGSDGEVDQMTADTLSYVDQAIAATEGRDVTLIVGNALPKVAGDTSAPLVKQHRAYNEGVAERAAANANVVLFDQYSLLVGPDGALSRGLAVSADDSHLNDVAYQVLDEEFFVLLDGLK